MTWLGHCGLDYNTSDISLILSILLSVIETNMGISYTYISVMKTWAGAQAYCRQNHTDIVMIEDEALNTQIFNMKPAINIWLGLSRVAWMWADTSPVNFSNWQNGKPYNSGAQHCAAEDSVHRWMAAGCQNLNPFLCHEGICRVH